MGLANTFPGPDVATDTTPQARSALGGTMMRVLAGVLSRKNQLFHLVQTDWCDTDPGPPEPKIIYSTSLGPALPTDATPRTRSVLGGPSPPKRERLGFPANLRGARARGTRRQKGADCAPPLEEHPPNELAEFRVPAP